MKKKFLIIMTVVLLCLTIFATLGCEKKYDTELVTNGNFETLNDSLVAGWTKSENGKVTFVGNTDSQAAEYDAKLDRRYASLTASSSTFDYLQQTITVKRGVKYQISAYIKVTAITPTNDIGARVGFLEDSSFIGLNIKETTTGFQQFETYFVSAVNGEMTLTVGLGSSSNRAAGTISFDNISVKAVESIPVGFEGEVETLKNGKDYSLSNGLSNTFVALGAIIGAGILLCLYFVLRKAKASDAKPIEPLEPESIKDTKKSATSVLLSPIAMFVYVMLALFVSRFIMVLTSQGMQSNILALEELAQKLVNNGAGSIFSDASVNQPTGVLYVLWGLGGFAQAVDVTYGSLGYSILIRLPMIIADLVTAYMIFNFASKNLGEKSGLVMLAVYTFVPVFAILSGLYGSFECVAIAFAIGCMIAMLEKKHISCGVLFTLGLLFSNYMLLLLPIVLIYQVVTMIKDTESIKVVLPVILLSFVAFYALSLPFCINEVKTGNVFYVFKKMFNFFNASSFLSTDTFNLYAIFGRTNDSSRNTFIDICNWLFVIGMAAFAVYIYLKSKNRMDLLLIGGAMFTLYPLLGAQATLTVLPIGLALLLLYICVHQDRRLYWSIGGLSILSFINIAGLMSRCGYLSANANAAYLSFIGTSAFMIVFSVLSVALAIYLIYVIYDICMLERSSDIPELNQPLKAEMKQIALKVKKKLGR